MPSPSSVDVGRALALERSLEDLRAPLLRHPLYEQLVDLPALRSFTEVHIFAVWDFMSLVKSLQRALTCTCVPWVPPMDPEAARVINEVVLGEETDETPEGTHASHFTLYLRAMRDLGADTGAIERFLGALSEGQPLPRAFERGEVPLAARRFVSSTLDLCANGRLHQIAASFVFGREKVIPDMFRKIVLRLGANHPDTCGTLLYYLDRHITLDEDQHGPAGLRLVTRLCGDDETRWTEALEASRHALEERLTLWNAIEERLRTARSSEPLVRGG